MSSLALPHNYDDDDDDDPYLIDDCLEMAINSLTLIVTGQCADSGELSSRIIDKLNKALEQLKKIDDQI